MAGSTKKVAVIGAGMAGLVSARELQKEGHEVVVFEKGHRVGGTWVYDPRVETDLLGLDPDREVVHSSMFESLRVNLPRQLMGFSDYPFVRKESGDPRSFPRHEEVLRYLEDFSRDFGLDRLVRFGHDVIRVEPVGEAWTEWVVGWRGKEKELGQDGEEIFQAVVVCNGKHTQPRVVDFPGRDTWPGIQMHSHNYRIRDPFINKVVVVIGDGTSASEIINEINGVAKEVHQCRRSSHSKVAAELDQVRSWQLHPMIERAEEDGNVVFQDQTIVLPDVIIHCTGYIFHFPFLRTKGRVTVDDNRIGPLYQHVFPPSMSPWLSFVGFSMLSITSIQARLQAKWVARVLSGKACLPTEKEMFASVEAFYQHLEEASIPKRHTHHIWQDTWEYEKWLIAELGEPPLERWIEELSFPKAVKLFSSLGENYRDTWDVDNWIQEVQSSNK